MSKSSILMLFIFGVLAGIQVGIIMFADFADTIDYVFLVILVAAVPVVVYTDPIRQAKKKDIFS